MNETMLALFDGSQLPATAIQRLAQPLARNGLQLSPHAVAALQEQRASALGETERVELGPGALPLIAETLASSPFLLQSNLFDALAQAQQTFYRLRDEIPVDVPDEELAEALRSCFDRFEGNLEELEALDAREIYSPAKPLQAGETLGSSVYRICDEDGREYVFDPQTHSVSSFPCGNGDDVVPPWSKDGSAHPFGTSCSCDDLDEFGAYTSEWDYDEFADGWNGEKWSDDLD